jgi:hypothetical protein
LKGFAAVYLLELFADFLNSGKGRQCAVVFNYLRERMDPLLTFILCAADKGVSFLVVLGPIFVSALGDVDHEQGSMGIAFRNDFFQATLPIMLIIISASTVLRVVNPRKVSISQT